MHSKTMVLKIVLLLSLTVGLVGVSACSNTNDSEKTIVTSFYPIEFVAKRIAGKDFKVVNLTPQGAEPHDIELSPNKTQLLQEAKLAIVLGGGFQPAIEKTAESRDDETLNLMNKLYGDKKQDPHIWLDPSLMQKVVKLVTEQIKKINPENTDLYSERSELLIQDLQNLDKKYKEGLSQCVSRTFVTSHDAFSRLATRYGLRQESIAGISPENEPSPARLNELKKLVEEKNVSVIFTEELVSDKVAKSLSS